MGGLVGSRGKQVHVGDWEGKQTLQRGLGEQAEFEVGLGGSGGHAGSSEGIGEASRVGGAKSGRWGS